jgi:phosphinothricin acetyltransferase
LPVIRPAHAADAPGCLEIYAPIVTDSAVSFETEVPPAGEFAARIERTLRDYPWLVAEAGGRIAGYAYACRHRERAAYRYPAEVSAYVAADRRRLGTGRVLYTELFGILRRQGYCNALAGITLPNPASVAFHESLGFAPVGVYHRTGYKLGRWHDVGWWELRLREENKPASRPIPFSALGD